jgi:hypothetical protein
MGLVGGPLRAEQLGQLLDVQTRRDDEDRRALPHPLPAQGSATCSENLVYPATLFFQTVLYRAQQLMGHGLQAWLCCNPNRGDTVTLLSV